MTQSFEEDSGTSLEDLAIDEWTTEHVIMWLENVNKSDLFEKDEVHKIKKWMKENEICGKFLREITTKQLEEAFPSKDDEDLIVVFSFCVKYVRCHSFNPKWGFVFTKILYYLLKEWKKMEKREMKQHTFRDILKRAYERAEGVVDEKKFYKRHFEFFPEFFKYLNMMMKGADLSNMDEWKKNAEKQRRKVNVAYNILSKGKEKEFIKVNSRPKDIYREYEIEQNDRKAVLKFPFKIVITELASPSKFRKIMTPMMLSLKAIPFVKCPVNYGMFHLAFIIGPWYLEWCNNEIVTPKYFSSKRALVAGDVQHKYKITIDNVERVAKKLCRFIYTWNNNKEYDSFSNNCQHFYQSLCREFGVNEKRIRRSFLKPVLSQLRKGGEFKFLYKPKKNVRQACNFTKKHFEFKTHRELDTTVKKILANKKVEMEFRKHSDYKLLKSYDRAFWLKHFDNPGNAKFQPLGFDQDEDIIELDIEDDILDDILVDTKCPFEDPRDTGSFQVDSRLYLEQCSEIEGEEEDMDEEDEEDKFEEPKKKEISEEKEDDEETRQEEFSPTQLKEIEQNIKFLLKAIQNKMQDE